MSPEEHELLRRSIALSEENNDILRGIQRHMRLNRFMTLLYWLVIIGIAVGAWYFVEPYVGQVESFYKSAQAQLESISNNVNNTSDAVNNVVNSVKKAVGQ